MTEIFSTKRDTEDRFLRPLHCHPQNTSLASMCSSGVIPIATEKKGYVLFGTGNVGRSVIRSAFSVFPPFGHGRDLSAVLVARTRPWTLDGLA